MPKRNISHAELQALLNNLPNPIQKEKAVKRKSSSVTIDKRKFVKEEDYIHFECIQLLKNEFPNVKWVSNILDGARLGMLVRKHTKGMRNEAGTSDIVILEPRSRFHGMCLEIKTTKGVMSQEQLKFILEMNVKGYYSKCGYGLKECFELIKGYLGYA